jgi:AcrR family transcriptional regulator
VADASKVRKQVLTDLRRTEIIAAALKIFGTKGFAAARAEDIATQADIAKGTLYLYFRSKEDIYVAAVQHAIDQLNERVSERLQSATGIRQRVAAFVTARLEFWLERRSLYRLLLTVGREAQHRKQTNALLRTSAQSVVALLEEAIAAGEIEPQPLEAISWAVIDLLRGANERRLDGVVTHPIEKDAEFITRLTLRTLGLPEQP